MMMGCILFSTYDMKVSLPRRSLVSGLVKLPCDIRVPSRVAVFIAFDLDLSDLSDPCSAHSGSSRDKVERESM
jgi:hypothetical protein